MSIEGKVAKVAVKQVTKGWRNWIEPVRRFLTKRARKAEGKQNIQPYAIAFMALSLTGCSTINKSLIAVDDSLYGSSTAGVLLPDGHILQPYVTDAADNRQNIDGWKVKYEIVPVAGHVHREVKDVIMQGRRAPKSAVVELIAGQLAAGDTAVAPSAAGNAAAMLLDAADKAGVK